MLRLTICLIMVLALGAAHAKKIYSGGEDPLIAACVEQCNLDKMSCRDQLRDQYHHCKNNYKRLVEEYDWCRNAGGRLCRMPERCRMVRTVHCNNGYDACFVGCGGTIEDSKKKRPRKSP